jgi:hypothetical protein
MPSNAMQKNVQNLHQRPDFVEYGFFTTMIHNWKKTQQVEMLLLAHN